MSKSLPLLTADRDGRLLLTAAQAAAGCRGGGADRAAAQGAGRPGPAAAALAGRVARRPGGLRLRPERRLRPLPADDQPPPQGAPRGRAARPEQARRLGLLPRPTPRRWPTWAPCSAASPGDRDAPARGRRAGRDGLPGDGRGRVRDRGHAGSTTDVGLQLLENSVVTGAALVALILALQPVSASFNPVVTLVERALGVIDSRAAACARGCPGRRWGARRRCWPT